MIKRLALALILALLALPAAAQRTQCHAVDGDTLACGVKRVRIIGLDTPELRGRCPLEIAMARQARARLAELIAPGVTFRPAGRDRYGRLLATVLDRRGRDVALVMITEGLARPYTGRTRRERWC